MRLPESLVGAAATAARSTAALAAACSHCVMTGVAPERSPAAFELLMGWDGRPSTQGVSLRRGRAAGSPQAGPSDE